MSRKDVFINLLFCLRYSHAKITVYNLKEGVFQILGDFSEEEADALLAPYEKYGLLSLALDDVYSGLYILASETKKIYDKNVHIYAGRVLSGFRKPGGLLSVGEREYCEGCPLCVGDHS